MNIVSYGFILLFVPIALILYWKVMRHSDQKLWLLCIVSYVFYALGGLPFIVIILGLSLITYWSARVNLNLLGIVLNVAVLIVFKYLNFGANYMGILTSALPFPIWATWLNGVLPLGISFYVFKHIGYLLDIRSKRYPATLDWLAFITFSALFMQISAGPISSFRDTGKQLRNLPQKADPSYIRPYRK